MGQLVKVMANSPKDGEPPIVVIEDTSHYLSQDELLIDDMKSYPGPLVK